jgi:hypothetical protein
MITAMIITMITIIITTATIMTTTIMMRRMARSHRPQGRGFRTRATRPI